MAEIIIYEGMMCCSTGLCGPEPDHKLIEFNSAITRLKEENVNIKRVNLSSHLGFFKENKEIFVTIQKEGAQTLPIVCVNGKIVMKKKYPSYDEMKSFSKSKGK